MHVSTLQINYDALKYLWWFVSLKFKTINYIYIYDLHLKKCFTQIFAHPQTIQEVDEFVSSSEQMWRNLALHHLLTNDSSVVNGCRQKEWVQTSYKNITIIHTNPVHELMPCEAKSCIFIRNKSIKTLNYCFLLKYKGFCLLLSPVTKLKWICTDQAPFTVQNRFKQICCCILMWEDNKVLTLSLQEVLLWIILARSDSLKWKCPDGFVSYIISDYCNCIYCVHCA